MGRTFNREQVYICGDYLDGDIYPVFQPAGKRRKRCKPTSEIQARLNQRNAEKALTRTIHANFTDRDYALHLTYAAAPKDKAEAARCVRNYLNKLRRRFEKAGAEFKYILSTEYGGRGGRIHHHLIVSGGMDRDTLEALWGHGYANSKRLQFTESGVTGLAHYISKDSKTSRDGTEHIFKRWSGSRNLVKPEPVQFDGRLNMAQAAEVAEKMEEGNAPAWFEALYPDFVYTGGYSFRNSVNRGVYIHFEMRRKRPGEQE